jgi:hypothetical protein
MKQLIVTPIVLVKLNVTSILMKQLIVISNIFVVQIQYSYNNFIH